MSVLKATGVWCDPGSYEVYDVDYSLLDYLFVAQSCEGFFLLIYLCFILHK